MKTKEIRMFASQEMRVVRADGDKPKIVGHAAVFDSPTKIGGSFWGFTEEIAPGAFKDSIKEDDIRALFNHDVNLILGRNVSGTLELSEDDKGLKYEIIPPETSVATDLLESIDRGDISGSSFMFDVLEEQWTMSEEDNEPDKRRLLKLKLWDVSPVTFPAYEDTDVAKRKHEEFRSNALVPEVTENRETEPTPAADPTPEEKKNPEPQVQEGTGNRDNMSRRLRLTD